MLLQGVHVGVVQMDRNQFRWPKKEGQNKQEYFSLKRAFFDSFRIWLRGLHAQLREKPSCMLMLSCWSSIYIPSLITYFVCLDFLARIVVSLILSFICKKRMHEIHENLLFLNFKTKMRLHELCDEILHNYRFYLIYCIHLYILYSA
jgi:hypothetical protein